MLKLNLRIQEKVLKKKIYPKYLTHSFTTKPVGQGTGLGMSISYRVIQNHYGSINVESEVGQGATFTIVIPINHQNGNNIPAPHI